MADPVVKFSPFWTQGREGGSEILDRNLAAMQKAIENANATITNLQTTINQIISGDTNISINFPAGPRGIPGMDGDDSSSGDVFMGPPGRDGARGRDGVSLPGLDGDDGLDGLPGAAGARGVDGQRGRDGLDGSDGDDGGGFLPMQEISGLPLAALPSEYTTTGDVATVLNGDSRIRSNYCRVVSGEYLINDPAELAIEDNAELMVL